MLKIVFTSDHEIHGNGEGDPLELMVEPTDRMLKLFDRYGAKLTIMADVAEIMKFREYRDREGRDKFHYDAIVEQLQRAVRTGHDVQLHVHSSYYNAVYTNGGWEQDYSEYDLARLRYKRLDEIIGGGKEFLESLLKPVKPDYECFAFRAANWSMQPSENIVRALVENGFSIDTSVFKYGGREGLVNFDYSNACQELIPWQASEKNICEMDPDSKLCEIPIYCEKRLIWAFVSLNRFYRVITGFMHQLGDGPAGSEEPAGGPVQVRSLSAKLLSKGGMLVRRHAWKMDFNQCTGGQLIGGLKRALKKYGHLEYDLPLVIIGHSKLFTKSNEKSLTRFLEFVSEHAGQCAFGTFARRSPFVR